MWLRIRDFPWTLRLAVGLGAVALYFLLKHFFGEAGTTVGFFAICAVWLTQC